MPDQYGDITQADLQDIYEAIELLSERLGFAMEALATRSARRDFEQAEVKLHATSQQDEADYGVGAIQVLRSSDDLVWVRPRRRSPGAFVMPPIGSFVEIEFPFFSAPSIGFYLGPVWQDGITRRDIYDGNFDNKEEIGFVGARTNGQGDDFGGKRLVEARKNPADERIVYSSGHAIIGERVGKKTIDVSVEDGWEIQLRAGNGGKVSILAADPVSEAVGGSVSVDLEVDLGQSGAANIKTKSGKLHFETDSGDIDAKSSSGKIALETTSGNMEFKAGSAATEKTLLGETMKGLVSDLMDETSAIQVPTPLGLSGPPTNAGKIAVIKSKLPNALSQNIKHN